MRINERVFFGPAWWRLEASLCLDVLNNRQDRIAHQSTLWAYLARPHLEMNQIQIEAKSTLCDYKFDKTKIWTGEGKAQ